MKVHEGRGNEVNLAGFDVFKLINILLYMIPFSERKKALIWLNVTSVLVTYVSRYRRDNLTHQK